MIWMEFKPLNMLMKMKAITGNRRQQILINNKWSQSIHDCQKTSIFYIRKKYSLPMTLSTDMDDNVKDKILIHERQFMIPMR